MLYRPFLRSLLFRLPPETAHDLALQTLTLALNTNFSRRVAARRFSRQPFGELRRFGLTFANPVGLAAGFDKNGAAASALAALGFGFVEVGTTTHLPQPGNPRPRLFRLPMDRALINRAGFNNDGAARLAETLAHRRPLCVLGVNIGKSRAVAIEDAVADYLASFDLVYKVADYIAINVSSPNTPKLRELQQAEALTALLGAIQQRNCKLAEKSNHPPLPLLVKISPDLDLHDLEMIVDVVLANNVAGIIATNTTTSRLHLRTSAHKVQAYGEGGLSGAPLGDVSTKVIATLYRLARSKLEIIGVGGIFNAADAWEKISAGASLVQLYTGLVYEGIGVVRNINDGLADIMHKHGVRSLDEAVGSRSEELSAVSYQPSATG